VRGLSGDVHAARSDEVSEGVGVDGVAGCEESGVGGESVVESVVVGDFCVD